jgi:signal transduction histidine kinase
LKASCVLVVSDDAEFGRLVLARWQAAQCAAEITVVTSDLWRDGHGVDHDLVIVGPINTRMRPAILSALSGPSTPATVYLSPDEKHASAIHATHPQFSIVRRQDGWLDTLILISVEALRRVEAMARARRAENIALAREREATLGRYMLEVRPSVNNALTSVLGNADLLLLEPAQISGEYRQQIQTIHTMALRLNEILQRFSSLAAEMRAGEPASQMEKQLSSW